MTNCPKPILLVCAAIGVACGSDNLVEPERTPVFATLEVTPTGARVLQSGSATVAATMRRSGVFNGAVNLTVTGLPTGVAAVISDVQSTAFVTTATVTLKVSGSTIPGDYSLVLHGTGTGITGATAAFGLSVEPISPCTADGVCEQWAASATASSEYMATGWSANQATGWPNAAPCEDDAHSWASAASNGIDWLELEYGKSVRPTEIRIHEMFGVSSIVKVEVKDGAGTYHTVYTAQSGSQNCPRVLTIPVTGISAMVKVVRLSFDQRALNIWDEIDAVKLIGNAAPLGASSEIAGVYDLSAPITSFDPAWFDFTGFRYKAVLTLHQTSRDRFEGTYAGLQIVGPAGESDDWEYTGFVKGSLDLNGRVVIELIGGNHTWTSWYGQGQLASSEISGEFGCCGHISGTFTVVRRQTE